MKISRIIIAVLVVMLLLPALLFAEKEVTKKIIVKTDDGKEYVYEGEDAENFDIQVDMEGEYPELKSKIMIMSPDGKELNLEDFDIDLEIMDDFPMVWNAKPGMHMIPYLTEEQEKKIQDIEFNIQNRLIDIEAKVKKAELEMEKMVNDEAKLKDLQKKIEEIGKLNIDIEKIKMEQFVKVRDILTKEQKKMYNMVGPVFHKIPHMNKKEIITDKDMTEKE